MDGSSDRPSRQHAVPNEFAEHIDTGVIEDPGARAAARRRKSETERIERAEERLDAHDVVLAKMSAQMDGQDVVLDLIKGSVQRLENRDHITFTAKLDIAKAQALDELDAEKTKRRDAADAAKNNRKRITQIVGGVIAIFSSGVFLHWLVGRM